MQQVGHTPGIRYVYWNRRNGVQTEATVERRRNHALLGRLVMSGSGQTGQSEGSVDEWLDVEREGEEGGEREGREGGGEHSRSLKG